MGYGTDKKKLNTNNRPGVMKGKANWSGSKETNNPLLGNKDRMGKKSK